MPDSYNPKDWEQFPIVRPAKPDKEPEANTISAHEILPQLSDQEIKDREMLFPGYLKYLQEAGLEFESAFLPAFGIIPTELHRMYGWFGKTAAEPEGQYNLGTGAPGSRRPKTPPPKED